MDTSESQHLLNEFLRTRDPSLRETLILHHVSLVHFTLGRMGIFADMGADYEDLVSQGLLGLIDAVDRYSPQHGAQFSTYAIFRIRGKILDYLRSQDWLSRVGRQRARMVQQAISELWGKLQRPPTEEELAEHLNLTIPQVQQALVDSSRLVLSLDSPIEDEGENDLHSLYEILTDEEQPSPIEKLDEEELHTCLVEALKQLPTREQQILALYYYEGLTLKEIGHILGISESRVCQIHARAIFSLRAALSTAGYLATSTLPQEARVSPPPSQA
ncbi:FliA/WhiG family RNA polymerase sigma factor [Thermanaerothrix sp. 4228-RoL]|uniref:RNA polymerase sigma factor n=1 Tax=Thermanaerothrix solaris TaxID=3058434 RepID=A0ABU3NLD7_9CHLR|nr:FliA/WhiG family RNA polymerase sigma factor [Thermanaerothrix sp. 4228-RoL]MDT8897664.1 FliA/WhiG family RNA polymerase sigma factor [Thermanaerothrix sp. 4228-RoL]